MERKEAIQILETQFPHDSIIREALATTIPEFRERIEMEQETKAKIEQVMELADKYEKGYKAGAYDIKFKILRWATERKKAIEANGDEDDAFERGEYSILNALIDKINQVQHKKLTTAHQLVCVYSSPLWPDDVLDDLWDFANSLLQNTELSDFRREQLMKERCEEIRMQRNKK